MACSCGKKRNTGRTPARATIVNNPPPRLPTPPVETTNVQILSVPAPLPTDGDYGLNQQKRELEKKRRIAIATKLGK